MTERLIAAVDKALANLAQEFHHEASVIVQYAAGDWHELKEALAEARAFLEGKAAPTEGGGSPTPPVSAQEPAGAAPASDEHPEVTHEEPAS